MGFLSNLRAASTVSFAVGYLDKYMKVAVAAGSPPPGNTSALAKKLVMALWSETPALAMQTAWPKPISVASAAVAHAIRQFDAEGKRAVADQLLFPCLRLLVSDRAFKEAGYNLRSAIDNELRRIALSVFEQAAPAVPDEMSALLWADSMTTPQQQL